MEDKSSIKINNDTYDFRDRDLKEYGKSINELVEDINDVKELFDNRDENNESSEVPTSKNSIELFDNGIKVIYGDKTNGMNFDKVSPHMLEMIQVKQSPLYGKRLIALGDSYIANNGQEVTNTWWMRIAQKYNMDYYNFGINGAMTFAYGANNLLYRFRNVCSSLAETLLNDEVITKSFYDSILAKYGVNSESELASEIERNTVEGWYNSGSDNPDKEVWLKFYRDLFKDAFKDSYIVLTGGRNDYSYILAYYKKDGSYVDCSVNSVSSFGYKGAARKEYYELNNVRTELSPDTQDAPWKSKNIQLVCELLFSRITYIFSLSKILFVTANRYQDCNNLDNEIDNAWNYQMHSVSGEYRLSQINVNNAIMNAGKKYGIQFYDSQHESPVKAWNGGFRSAFMQSSDDSSHFNADGHKFIQTGIDEYLNSL